MFSYEIHEHNENAVVQLTGDLDIDVTEVIEDELIPALSYFTNIEFDFSLVPFVDSTGIGLLLNLIETVKKNGEEIQIKVNHIQPLVKEVFDMLQLDEILGKEVILLR